ncbi:hypothetical protein, partial [Leucobacter sp. M11]|uniref:hypothetical protein n=1 Tax=Leucobacter sp. M11 TaxID=2993565 RepID=UPI002DB0123F|nr:hypothetical protein [Leucobacter sp. M11]
VAADTAADAAEDRTVVVPRAPLAPRRNATPAAVPMPDAATGPGDAAARDASAAATRDEARDDEATDDEATDDEATDDATRIVPRRPTLPRSLATPDPDAPDAHALRDDVRAADAINAAEAAGDGGDSGDIGDTGDGDETR